MFRNWVMRNSSNGYNSYGNGSAMRVSFIGEHFETLEEVEAQAEKSSICTHSHPEGIKAARVTAGMIHLARQGESKKKLLHYAKQHGYQTAKPVWMYRPFSEFDTSAMGTMPLAIRCFFESDDWESCIRKAFSVTCDMDTVCCIAGSIAEAFYGKTGYDDIGILKRYLIQPDRNGRFDTYLFDWATKKTI